MRDAGSTVRVIGQVDEGGRDELETLVDLGESFLLGNSEDE